jgi:hypothetical protein
VSLCVSSRAPLNRQSLGKFDYHRYQLEERFVHNASKLTLEDGTTFYLRFRYRIQGDFGKDKYLKGIVYDEIMINGGTKLSKNTLIKTVRTQQFN